MSDAPKPDAIVREPEARASVEELTKGLAEDARRNGVLPPILEIEKFAKEITHDTIARHEERFRNGVPDAKLVRGGNTGASPATIDRGSFEDDFGRVDPIARPFDAKRHLAKAKRIDPADVLEAKLADDRLALLLSWTTPTGRISRHRTSAEDSETYPEWAARIRKTWTETLALSKNLDPGANAHSDAADAVLKILDASNATFGDWRNPKGPDGKPLRFYIKVTNNVESTD